jgi:hypothetical protein
MPLVRAVVVAMRTQPDQKDAVIDMMEAKKSKNFQVNLSRALVRLKRFESRELLGLDYTVSEGNFGHQHCLPL